jgi:hypothetical protein
MLTIAGTFTTVTSSDSLPIEYSGKNIRLPTGLNFK